MGDELLNLRLKGGLEHDNEAEDFSHAILPLLG